VIAGEAVMSVTADLNKRRVPSTDGVLWDAATLRRILRNPILAELGIIPPADFEKLQAALDATAQTHSPVCVPCRNYLGLIYCARCGAKVYRWYRNATNTFHGRCRNELKRYEVASPCDMPMVSYDVIGNAIRCDVEHEHGADLIETRLTSVLRDQRADEISRELIRLAGKFTTEAMSREAYLARQAELMNEAEALHADRSAGMWTPTGETVGQRWARLGDKEARLWLAGVGVRYTLECVRPPTRRPSERHRWDAGEWTVTPSWPQHAASTALDRIVPPLPQLVTASARRSRSTSPPAWSRPRSCSWSSWPPAASWPTSSR